MQPIESQRRISRRGFLVGGAGLAGGAAALLLFRKTEEDRITGEKPFTQEDYVTILNNAFNQGKEQFAWITNGERRKRGYGFVSSTRQREGTVFLTADQNTRLSLIRGITSLSNPVTGGPISRDQENRKYWQLGRREQTENGEIHTEILVIDGSPALAYERTAIWVDISKPTSQELKAASDLVVNSMNRALDDLQKNPVEH